MPFEDYRRWTFEDELAAAEENGWQLAGVDGTAQKWVGPRGISMVTVDTRMLASPLKFAMRVARLGIFRRVCPECGERLCFMSPDVLEAAREDGVAGCVLEDPAGEALAVAIPHQPDCVATERQILAMAAAGSN
jgi:hypothetical protein